MRHTALFTALALAVLTLSIVPIGGAVFVLGFALGDSPCVMCWEQRTGMILVALTGLFVLRYGARPRYIGLAVLVGAWGIWMAVRHTAMHAARDVGQGFSLEILGAHTYTWAFVIFLVCVVTMGMLLMIRATDDVQRSGRTMRPLETWAMAVFLLVVGANIVQAFASTGPPPFLGQSDPVRFSFNPRHWVWSTEEWSYAPISLRGRWSIEEPDISRANPDPAAGPLGGLSDLKILERRRLQLPVRGTPTDLAYDAAGDRFLLTTQQGVYILDGTLSRILRYTIVDPGFSVDLGRFAGAAFLEPDTVMAAGENKSYVVLRENDRADADGNFRFFLESFDRFDEVTRARFTTVRARLMYAMSLAYDPAGRWLYTMTVPNGRNRQLVVSRFDRRDLALSEEFVPALGAESGLTLRGDGRSLAELYVTGATFADGRLYALSAAYRTLLEIDPASHTVVAARTIPGIDRPTGIAIKGSALYVVCENGDVMLVQRPG